jgi:hypothetical protein
MTAKETRTQRDPNENNEQNLLGKSTIKGKKLKDNTSKKIPTPKIIAKFFQFVAVF